MRSFYVQRILSIQDVISEEDIRLEVSFNFSKG